MLSEKKCNSNTNHNALVHRVPSSSSTCSSPTSLYPLQTKTMEEVWKDINLTSLNDHHAPSNSNYRSVIFQDFLARSPYDSPTSVVSSAQDNPTSSLYGPGSPAPPLVTALSLGSMGPDFPCVDPLPKRADFQARYYHLASNVSSFTTNPFESPTCASGFPSFGNKRQLLESNDDDDNNNNNNKNNNNDNDSSGNERRKRMIKNRESAARSRARKQAYTNELEQKVDYLSKENERLRKQQEQWCKASATHKKKNPLYRTSTAPF